MSSAAAGAILMLGCIAVTWVLIGLGYLARYVYLQFAAPSESSKENP